MTLYMPLFRSCTSSRTIAQLHAHLFVTGLHKDPLASTKLIESYAQMGTLKPAQLVFDHFPNPDSFMWGVLIKCCVWNGLFEKAISLYNNMVYSNETRMTNFIFPSVLRACSGFGDLGMGQKVHGRVIKCGFESDSVVETSLLSMYGEAGRLDDAREVFDGMSVRDVVSWSSIVSSYVQNGEASGGLKVFCEMIMEGQEPDTVTMLGVAEACAEVRILRQAKSVHGYVLRKEIESDGSLDNSLIAMYGKCGDLYSAEVIFDYIILRSTSSWTVMITCYNQNGCYQEALRTFVEMQESNVQPNEVTMMGILSCFARLGWVRAGKSVHCFVVRRAMDTGCDLLGPMLIDLYANCGNVIYCQKIFDKTQGKHVISWNMIISGYVREGLSKEALKLFVQMKSLGILPDSFTLASVLSACGDISLSWFGHQIHGHIIKTSISSEFVKNSLMDMYSKCGFVDSAFMIFNEDQKRSVVTWNSMICGFSQNGNSLEAISLFDYMFSNCLEVDEVTFLTVIQACSNLGYLEKAKWVHHKLITCGVAKDTYINTALTDMYAKCGELQMAQRIFDTMLERSVVSWSAIIGGYGMHGEIGPAISLFKLMVGSGIKPNEVTFTNILSACSHAGYVDEGKSYFSSMIRDFGVDPTSEHFSCMVDLLSRAGDLDGAYRIVNTMPFAADASILGALLNGCRSYRRMDMIKSILRDLLNLETDDTGYYTLLSNIFAEGGDWDEFRMIRSMMTNMGLRKVQGYSTIEIDKTVHRFGANDKYHSQASEIYTLLEDLQSLIGD
ncbi:putative pentatricopeptide repeat-containing protein At1g69350, mitochondrial [Rhododendron vialii]|uniref:putative pentatricopeptide repeat-containing protein At1g69350, mitochondrial n=1 Tax=Rhododendron vialii TaxID=182163 RepID=UPI00265FB31A|nr:putative pentatricopeptide repeat-containing protein At1g69350, mitochondrial [Rhododendron vialii]